ncbi:SDR family NAD(P)-dependent oxidoreductase [Paeniglutamicibacter gangotriensis]|uniref:Beta-ketoacyl-acyl carrier protein reductase n=2 Tax=Paeniglutamicibacter gangotriensis TaxID=254787 RepID=M7NPP8_9MICC|nr:SDR family oxidoreductase [Paeniglutamicibacter gangotriensis]EMR00504.1 beta-ketoacyl-acyl carrier protein reductase [Paeniglutamicibacter gangotriensis Lz1y]KAA0975934.1 SDR family oxidoreductase [Paeniglutamicibacter gangotriensis]
MNTESPTAPGTVLITGAAGGLGRAFALGFAKRGYRIAAADIDPAGTATTVELVQAAGGTAAGFTVDVTSRASTEALAAEVAGFAGGHIQVLINNAAIYATVTRSPFEDIDTDEWDRVMAVNLKGPWLMARALSPHLGAGSRIINLASATVYSGSEQWAHYVASKGGVIALSRVMAKELGRRDITVNTIAPGFTLTEASFGLMENAESYGVDRGALKRASQPEDIVGAALFLAGPDSSFITGQTLVVDGGRQFI